MDLGAYVQIDDLEKVANKNGIAVSRVRGYRLMGSEQPVDKDDLAEMKKDAMSDAIRTCVEMGWDLNAVWSSSNYYTRKYLKKHKTLESIHGKKRKMVKYVYKKICESIDLQMGLWNKYAGNPNVLYIHAKLGTTNWSDTIHSDYQTEQWYLGSCNDWYDSAYCDIYAKIN